MGNLKLLGCGYYPVAGSATKLLRKIATEFNSPYQEDLFTICQTPKNETNWQVIFKHLMIEPHGATITTRYVRTS